MLSILVAKAEMWRCLPAAAANGVSVEETNSRACCPMPGQPYGPRVDTVRTLVNLRVHVSHIDPTRIISIHAV